MNLTMLGTGNALVTECYNTCFILQENNQYFMVDGGGGNTILHQLKHAGIDWKNGEGMWRLRSHRCPSTTSSARQWATECFRPTRRPAT